MGYTTDFAGRFELNKELDEELNSYLIKFSDTRRMKRNLPEEFGVEGEFYVDGEGMAGQAREDNIINYNSPPSTQPGLWCQWIPTTDKMGIQWDGGEKFYDYVEWLAYIVDNFLEPNGYVLNGQVRWQGEDIGDVGVLAVKDNVITSHPGITDLYADDDVEKMATELINMLDVYSLNMEERDAFVNKLREFVNGEGAY